MREFSGHRQKKQMPSVYIPGPLNTCAATCKRPVRHACMDLYDVRVPRVSGCAWCGCPGRRPMRHCHVRIRAAEAASLAKISTPDSCQTSTQPRTNYAWQAGGAACLSHLWAFNLGCGVPGGCNVGTTTGGRNNTTTTALPGVSRRRIHQQPHSKPPNPLAKPLIYRNSRHRARSQRELPGRNDHCIPIGASFYFFRATTLTDTS